MSGFLLHFGATVQCSHGGQATPTAPSRRVAVTAKPITVVTTQYTVAACPNPVPPASNGPCVTAQFTTSATRVFSEGMPVLLFDSQATCVPTGVPLLIVSTEMRVTRL